MRNEIVPLTLEDVSENIYGGFWLRVASFFLDFIITIPLLVIMHYLHGLDKVYQIVTIMFFLPFGIWYNIYLPKKYGGTPGKLLVGIKILKINGKDIEWRESILRDIVTLILNLYISVVIIYCVTKADNSIYLAKGWQYKSQYILTFAPTLTKINLLLNNVWISSEFVVLLFNKRRRAIHDYMAGTVIVKTKYIEMLRQQMQKVSLEQNDIDKAK